MNEELHDKIEVFLLGQIGKDELKEAAGELTEAQLDQEIDIIKAMQLAVEAEGLRTELAETLSYDSHQQKTIVRQLKPMRSILAIAAMLVAILAAVFLMQKQDRPAMYAAYEYVDPGLPVVMGVAEDYEFSTAMTYFSEGNYPEVILRLAKLPQSDTVLYYSGASAYYDEQYSKAVDLLKAVDTSSVFVEEATYLRALALLKSQRIDAAQTIFKEIVNDPNHQFHSQADKLLMEF